MYPTAGIISVLASMKIEGEEITLELIKDASGDLLSEEEINNVFEQVMNADKS